MWKKTLRDAENLCVCVLFFGGRGFQGLTGLGIDDGEERWHLSFACRQIVWTNGGAREVSLLMIHLRGEDAAVIRLLVRAVFLPLAIVLSRSLSLSFSGVLTRLSSLPISNKKWNYDKQCRGQNTALMNN